MKLNFKKIYITFTLIACLVLLMQKNYDFNDIEKADEVWPQMNLGNIQ